MRSGPSQDLGDGWTGLNEPEESCKNPESSTLGGGVVVEMMWLDSFNRIDGNRHAEKTNPLIEDINNWRAARESPRIRHLLEKEPKN